MNTIIAQSIDPGQLVPAGTEVTLTYSNGQDPTGIVPFSLTLPSNATGRFVLDFLDSNGTTIAYSSTINAAFSSGTVNTPVEGTGVQQIVVILSNYATNQQAELGVYNFDFTGKSYSVVRESVTAAFEAVGGISHPTESTEAVTENVTDPIIATAPAEAPDPQETDFALDTIPDPLVEDPDSDGSDDVADAPDESPEE